MAENKKPLDVKSSLSYVRDNLRKPGNVDDDIFSDYLDILIANKSEAIIGVEVDHEIKAVLAERERRERERLAKITVRLNPEVAEAGNFPGERKEALPKYFDPSEIQPYLQGWVDTLQAEINAYFNFVEDEISKEKVKERFSQMLAEINAIVNKENETEKKKRKLKVGQNDLDLLAYTVLAAGIHDGDEFEELKKSITVMIYDEARAQDIVVFINKFKEEMRPLSASEMKEILDSINFSKYYTGGNITDEIGGGSRMLPAVDRGVQMQIRKDIKNQLMTMEFHPYLIREYIELFKLRFARSLCLEGKFVGNIMAAAIGESSTQQTLNTFHSSGDRKGRSQITGFQKLKAHLEASDNPPSVNNVIFMRKHMSEEEMFLNISKFQYCVLRNLIQNYKLLRLGPNENPKPRWERIHDAVFGTGRGLNHYGENERLNLHRDNDKVFGPKTISVDPVTGETKTQYAYVLQIQLNAQELYFRRLTVGMVAHALEENASSLIRVTSSNAALGIIYVYFNFQSIPAMNIFKDGTIPEYVNKDPFKFALENVVYRELQGVRVSGIPNLLYFAVKSNRNGLTIDFDDSFMQISGEDRRVTLSFIDIHIVSWGMSKEIIKEYVLVSLAPYAIDETDFNFEFDDINYQASFDTAGLRLFDQKSGTYSKLKMANVQTALMSESGDVQVGYIIMRNSEGVPLVEKVSAGDKGVDLRITINPKFLVTSLDSNAFFGLDLSMDSIGNVFANNYSSNKEDEEKTGDLTYLIEGNVVVVKNYEQDGALEPGESFQEYFLRHCYTLLVHSQRMEKCKSRLYYLCEGRNFEKILSHPMVDPICSRTDSSVDVYNFLGVESARTILVKEIRECVSDKLNPVHVDLMADSLTARTPKNKPLAQHFLGNNAKGTEFFALSFEKATDTFLKSIGSSDHLRSFPAQVIASRLDNRSLMNEEEKEFIMTDPSVFGVDFPTNHAQFSTVTGLVENVDDSKGEETVEEKQEEKIILNAPGSPRSKEGARARRRQRKKETQPVIETPQVVPESLPYAMTIYQTLGRKVYNPNETREDRIHYGQRKLLISEIMFLTPMSFPYCVYVGAAPGVKASWLAKLFPAVTFILIDPNPFKIKNMDGIKITKLKGFKISDIPKTKSNIILINEFMTNELAQKLSNLNLQCSFISDIRTTLTNNDSKVRDEDVVYNLIQQYNWVRRLKPVYSMLKFRHPFHDQKGNFNKIAQLNKEIEAAKAMGENIDFLKDYDNGRLKYFKGAIAIQAWSPAFSAETRLITDGKELEYLDDHDVYEQKMFYYNTGPRQEISDMESTGGFKGLGDDRIEYDVWQRYIKRFGGNLEEYLKITAQILEPLHLQVAKRDFYLEKKTPILTAVISCSYFNNVQMQFFNSPGEKTNLNNANFYTSNPYVPASHYQSLLEVRSGILKFLGSNSNVLSKAYKQASKEIAGGNKTSKQPDRSSLETILKQYDDYNLAYFNFVCMLPPNDGFVNLLLDNGSKGLVLANQTTISFPVKEGLSVKMVSGGTPLETLIDFNEAYSVINEYKNEGINLFIGAAAPSYGQIPEMEAGRELGSSLVILREVIISMLMLRKGGTSIIRIFDAFTRHTMEIVYLCSLFFEEVNIMKPESSSPQSSEKFLVCRRYNRPEGNSFVYQSLVFLYQNSTAITAALPGLFNPQLLKVDTLFQNSYLKMIQEFTKFQIDSLRATLARAEELSSK